jgi:lambda family phage portal protein
MVEKPQASVRRPPPQVAAFMDTVNKKALRIYEAAVSNNLNLDFPIDIGSANAQVFTSIWAGRARARTLERDNPYAFAILQSYQNNVCGDDPFRLEMNIGHYDAQDKWVKHQKENRMIEQAWKEAQFPENCTASRDVSRLELDCQVILSMIRDAGYIAEHINAFPKNKFHYALRCWEIDRLDHWWNGVNEITGNQIKHSIELDEFGGPVGYWLLTTHPGDIYTSMAQKQKYRRYVPAEDLIVFHDLRSRAEQLISMPRFSSIIQRLHRMDQFDIAHVTAAVWSACKPLFIIKKFPTAMEYLPESVKAAMVDVDKIQNESKLSPGETESLNYGEEPYLVDPKFPVEAAAAFKKEHLRAAAAGSGAAYHVIANDLESVNFSSGRLGLEEFRTGCKIIQRHFILSFRRKHFNEWLRNALTFGTINLPISRLEEFQLAANFHGRRWPYMQPLQDAQADAVLLKNRLASRDSLLSESDRGGDYQQVASELEADNDTDKIHNLDPFDPDGIQAGKDSGDETTVEETPAEKLGKT